MSVHKTEESPHRFGLTFEAIVVASFLHEQHKKVSEKVALHRSKAFFDGVTARFTANPKPSACGGSDSWIFSRYALLRTVTEKILIRVQRDLFQFQSSRMD